MQPLTKSFHKKTLGFTLQDRGYFDDQLTRELRSFSPSVHRVRAPIYTSSSILTPQSPETLRTISRSRSCGVQSGKRLVCCSNQPANVIDSVTRELVNQQKIEQAQLATARKQQIARASTIKNLNFRARRAEFLAGKNYVQTDEISQLIDQFQRQINLLISNFQFTTINRISGLSHRIGIAENKVADVDHKRIACDQLQNRELTKELTKLRRAQHNDNTQSIEPTNEMLLDSKRYINIAQHEKLVAEHLQRCLQVKNDVLKAAEAELKSINSSQLVQIQTLKAQLTTAHQQIDQAESTTKKQKDQIAKLTEFFRQHNGKCGNDAEDK